MKLLNLPHPLTPSPKRRGGIKIIAAVCAALVFIGCAQEDKETLFSDTEIAIIKTLIYQDAPAETSNSYEFNDAAATLGQKFFWDTRFSGGIEITGNRTSSPAVTANSANDFAVGQTRKIACVTCHDPNFGWADSTSRPNKLSLGANFTDRNAPTVLNAAHNTYSLWDGSVDSVWSVMRPAVEGNPHGFGRAGVAYVICNSASYLTEYTTIFGTTDTAAVCGSLTAVPTLANGWGRTTGSLYTGLTGGQRLNVDRIFANFGKAIAAYERKLVSKNSAFDQWANGNEIAMSASQKRGLKLFIGKGNCVRCHSGPNFADGDFHNLGVPQDDLIGSTYDYGQNTGITKLLTTTTAGNGYYNTASTYSDGGVNRVSGLSAATSHIGKFKTPTLRSVNLTPPYFHTGSFASLWDVVNFYNFAGNGGNFPGTKDTRLTTRRMTNEEMEDLVEFLKALEGEALSATLTTTPTLTNDIAAWQIPP
jgi:cytochrome c peroxidase